MMPPVILLTPNSKRRELLLRKLEEAGMTPLRLEDQGNSSGHADFELYTRNLSRGVDHQQFAVGRVGCKRLEIDGNSK